MTVLFEDKLRARQVTHVGYHAHDRAISMTEKERDALADAIEALRDLLYDENAASLDRGQAALARLDAA